MDIPMDTATARRTHLRGVGLIVAAFALFSVTDTLMKHLTGPYPLIETVFFTGLFALVPVIVLGLAGGGWRNLATRRPGLQLLRSGTGIAAGLGAFFAYTRMPLADAYAILFASPLIIAALSGPLLGERIDARRWMAILCGFAGVLVMLRPGADAVNVGALGALASALFFALSALIVRRAGMSETAASYPFYSNLMVVAIFGPLLPLVWVTPAVADLPLLAGSGLSSGLALFALLSAFRMAPAPVVAPFQYTQMLWGVLFGLVVFGDVPSLWLLAGAGVVIASGLYLLHRESRRPLLVAQGLTTPRPPAR